MVRAVQLEMESGRGGFNRMGFGAKWIGLGRISHERWEAVQFWLVPALRNRGFGRNQPEIALVRACRSPAGERLILRG